MTKKQRFQIQLFLPGMVCSGGKAGTPPPHPPHILYAT